MIRAALLLLFIILIIDLYGYYGLKKLFSVTGKTRTRRLAFTIFWVVDLLFAVLSILWILTIRSSDWPDYVQYRSYYYISGAFVLIYMPKLTFLVFVLVDDLRKFAWWIGRQFTSAKRKRHRRIKNKPASRALPVIGGVLSVVMFLWIVYGITVTRFNYQVEEREIYFQDLPQSFDGFRLIYIADTHLGSFARPEPVVRGLQMVGDLEGDLVLFAGDMINNEAVEAEIYVPSFEQIIANAGKFSILGNHDMGDYRRWYTIEEKDANLEALEQFQEDMGFELLRNEHAFISNGTDSIMIVGIDNWGMPPFAQYGDLQQALGEHADFPFKILLSHDPSHWRAQVLPQTDIQLMMAGHTHGAQAGILTPWFQWSPSVYIYPEWYGEYREGEQVLYVNRGFGFLGFPGRLGMPPEITAITLRRTPDQELD
ncbi:MAG: metallophosphoesterase [Bacteroidales bacterium]